MGTLIDFSDPCLRTFLPVLLQDHTTGKNIIWATDPPPELGVDFADEITLEQLDKVQIVPRVQKRLADQKKRTSKKAEVFTPTWVCMKMADVAENDLKGEGWKKYINKTCLEVTCGAVLGGRMMNPDEYFKDWAWRRDTGDLCPECYAEYKRVIGRFNRGKRGQRR